MQFTKYDLGNLEKGRIIEVTLKGNAANVRLMDSSNFNKYKNGKAHQFIGGLARRSPVRLQTTHSGHWYVTIDMLGLRGSVRTGVTVLPGQLPEIKNRPLSEIPSLFHDSGYIADEEAGIKPDYDVFISHASEDKDEVVRPLAMALRNCGIKVWYDEFELHIGDSLRRKIDRGLANSRFGIVIVSRDFIKKDGPIMNLMELFLKH